MYHVILSKLQIHQKDVTYGYFVVLITTLFINSFNHV